MRKREGDRFQGEKNQNKFYRTPKQKPNLYMFNSSYDFPNVRNLKQIMMQVSCTLLRLNH